MNSCHTLLFRPWGGGGGGHFHSRVIAMLVAFFRVKNYDFGIFLGSSGKFLENGSHFSQNNPKNCNWGIF